jgi:hypothetical protein
MVRFRRLLMMLASMAMLFAVGTDMLQAQSTPPAEPVVAQTLAAEEQHLADQYKHLEDVLLRMAELTASEDPRRAVLLRKAVAQSKEQLISIRLDRLVELLGKDQLSQALDNQKEVDGDLRSLLELLMSENRAKHIENEKARIREYLKQLNAIILREKDIQGRTAADDHKRLAGEQAGIAQKTGKLAEDVKKTEGGGEKTEGGGRKAEGGKEKESTDKRLETARQRMKEAEDKLKDAKRQDAAEKQEEAIRELQLAKANLEEILRQLREEEIERTLVMLEARFRKMLDMQNEVYEGTVRLDRVPADQRTHNSEIEASRLGGKQSQIVVEVDKALLLLHDDGSAAAFIEATEQMRNDMRQIEGRLAKIELGKITQTIEEDVIAALKEMVAALKKAQKDQGKKKMPPGQPLQSQSQEPPLVDVLAELRMVRALQMRVNHRTRQFSKMIEGEQAENAELIEELRQLAEREQRIQRVTRDLEMGKNQ